MAGIATWSYFKSLQNNSSSFMRACLAKILKSNSVLVYPVAVGCNAGGGIA